MVTRRANIKNLWHATLIAVVRHTILGLRPTCRLGHLNIEIEASGPAVSGPWSRFGYRVVGFLGRLVLWFCTPSCFIFIGRVTAQTPSTIWLGLCQTSCWFALAFVQWRDIFSLPTTSAIIMLYIQTQFFFNSREY